MIIGLICFVLSHLPEKPQSEYDRRRELEIEISGYETYLDYLYARNIPHNAQYTRHSLISCYCWRLMDIRPTHDDDIYRKLGETPYGYIWTEYAKYDS